MRSTRFAFSRSTVPSLWQGFAALALALAVTATAIVVSNRGGERDAVNSPQAALEALEELLNRQAMQTDQTPEPATQPETDSNATAADSSQTEGVHIAEPPLAKGSGVPAADRSEGWTPFTHWKRNGDGTITTEVYRAPTFHKVDGSWQRVRNDVGANSGDVAASAPNAFRPVRFGTDQNKLVQLALDQGDVTLSSTQLTSGRPEVAHDGSVTYQDVATDTDVRYRVTDAGVKEDIILRSPDAPRSFSFHLADPDGALGELKGRRGGGFQFNKAIDGEVAVAIPPVTAYEDTGVAREFPPFDADSVSLPRFRRHVVLPHHPANVAANSTGVM